MCFLNFLECWEAYPRVRMHQKQFLLENTIIVDTISLMDHNPNDQKSGDGLIVVDSAGCVVPTWRLDALLKGIVIVCDELYPTSNEDYVNHHAC